MQSSKLYLWPTNRLSVGVYHASKGSHFPEHLHSDLVPFITMCLVSHKCDTISAEKSKRSGYLSAAMPINLKLKSLFFHFLIWRLLTVKLENKKLFYFRESSGYPAAWFMVDIKLTYTIALQSTYHCRVNKCYLHGCRVNCTLSNRLPGEQVLFLPGSW